MKNEDIVERTYGIVAENKPLGQNTILVWAYQKTPWMQGDVQSQLQQISTKWTDADGNKKEAKARTDVAIEADWRPNDSNWATAPDVQRGECIELLRYADSPVYYWRERGDGAVKRRLETKRLLVSANRTAGDPDPTTHYMLEISGHNGSINLTTSAANGEVSTYAVTLNGKEGMASLCDGEGNEFFIATKDKVVRMRNSDESMVELNEQDVALYCLNNMGIVAKNKIVMKANQLEFIAGESIKHTAPDIYLNGIMHFNGPIVQDTTSTNFDATFKGTLRTSEDMIAGNISLINHPHSGVEKGNDDTGKPVQTE